MGLSMESSIFFSVLFSFLTVVGVVGNLVVIVAIAADPKMRRCTMNILLLNLAVADLANVLVPVGEWCPTVVLRQPRWILPDLLCPALRYLGCAFLFTSISTQLIVCLERYIATAHPMRARVLCSRSSALWAVGVAWVAALSFALPYATTHQVRHPRGTCSNGQIGSEWWRQYKLAEFLLYFLFPCSTIFFVYSRVATVLWATNPRLKNEGSVVVGGSSERQLATRRNVVKMLVACAVVYFLCYAPIQALFLSKALFEVKIAPPYSAILLLNALAVTCSASNPLLYALFSTRFRKRLKVLLSFSKPSPDKYTSISQMRPSLPQSL